MKSLGERLARLTSRWPSTYLGFPMAPTASKEPAGKGHPERQRGVSLLIAIMAIVVMVGLISDQIVTSSVQVELALSSRDRVKAEYLAKSGFNLGMFVLSLSQVKDVLMGSEQAGPMRESPHDGADSLWNLFKSFPPFGANTVDLIMAASSSQDDPFKLRGIMNEKVATQMRLFEDQFSLNIVDEGGKINVNDCARGACWEVLAQLTRLFSCPAEKAYLESKNIKPEELAYRIKDFIHESAQTPSSQSGLSESSYQEVSPSYGLKHLPFDSLSELKLIPGWDDDIHAIFAPYLTVFPFKQKNTNDNRFIININTAAPELMACLLPESQRPECAEKFAQAMHKLKVDDDTFASDEGKIKEKLSEIACYSPQEGQGEGGNPEKWFDVYSNVFRIIVASETGHQQRQLEVVVQRFDPGDEKKDNTMKKLKEQRPYRILYWKLI